MNRAECILCFCNDVLACIGIGEVGLYKTRITSAGLQVFGNYFPSICISASDENAGCAFFCK